MFKKLNKALLLISVAGFSVNAIAQYKTEKDLVLDAQKEDQAVGANKASAFVGRTFWIKPNPQASFRIAFRDLARWSGSEKFYVTSITSFTVSSIEMGENNERYAKVEFEDGKIGYLELEKTEYNIGSKKLKIIPLIEANETINSYQEYLFQVPPDQFLAAYDARHNKQKNITKSSFGVSIGMSAEQVLKSNWGKPKLVNKTTTTGGKTEQWVYGGNNYLYFSNGVLTAIQN